MGLTNRVPETVSYDKLKEGLEFMKSEQLAKDEEVDKVVSQVKKDPDGNVKWLLFVEENFEYLVVLMQRFNAGNLIKCGKLDKRHPCLSKRAKEH